MNNDHELVKMFLAGMAWERRKGDKPAIKQAIKDAMSQTRSAAQLLRAPDRSATELLRTIRNAGDVEMSDFSNEFWQEVDAVLKTAGGG
jgi:hypothetical protein